ncbi:lytic murein transglycosylase [Primorskyibacter sedentarius]|uniref:Lytic murein transglycosylase n=1 Tax=Primorskyibacter sedentarius TaxID=745311 RepID=A0A4R3JGK9_9RHOB|nr:lytic murein transglycosylase [Primorskyibacter sedentarius]TCS65289.1 lytic murein transglycosylase [Primorskyibacter sedentarius]
MRFVSVSLLLSLFATTTGSMAGPVERSIRPMPRPMQQKVVEIIPAAAPEASIRPMLRPKAQAGTPRPATVAPVDPALQRGLERWIAGFRARALSAGISASVFDRAMRGVRYDPEVIRRDRNQSEFTKSIGDYLASAASDSRVENGRAALHQHGTALEAIEARYGVEKEVVAAVWGMESAYGTRRGSDPVIGSLATLAFDGRRGKFFEQQLVAALKILQSGDTTPEDMKGSWAGAMGHTQFIPTSYLALAVDFTGDGKRDIWSDDPTDALASTANYLAKSGWKKGQPWGVEVRIPQGFDYSLARRDLTRMPSEWARLGVKGMDGNAVRDYGQASLLLPAGARGAAFMIFSNFKAIERYNAADAYVIGVGHLSDRLGGGAKIQATWPEGDRGLTYKERKEMQQRLTAAGFNTGGVDGRIGPKTAAAMQSYQRSVGLIPDGYASQSLLERLR